MMGVIGQLCLAQALQAQVILPVQELNIGIFQPQIAGKFTVDGGIGAFHVLPGFFKMDVVVDAMGTVAAAEEVATITNQVSGTITGRMIEDGQTVQKGDVLYTISHEEQTIQLTALEKQLKDSENREEMLRLYDGWLQGGTDFALSAVDNPYYSEIATRKMLVELQGESSQQLYSKELSTYETKLSANANMEEYYDDAIAKSRQLVEAIKSRSNPFGSEDAYYHNFMENYIVQYQNTGIQYDGKVKSLRNE